MSKNYLQILELAAGLSKEECIMLIKDISAALLETEEGSQLSPEVEQELLKRALITRSKVLSGEMKTLSLKEAKAKLNARKQA